MQRLPLVAAALTAVAGFLAAFPTAAAQPAAAASSYIVVLVDDAAPGRVAAEHGRAHGAEVSHVYRSAIHGYAARMTPAAAARIAADERVDWVQPDGVVHASAQELPTGVNRANADAASTAAGNGSGSVDVDVAIIDTGIDLDHPDLNVHTAGAKNCSTGKSAADGNGHGTHVAGTVGAEDDTTGVVGMAPGARVWPVRVLDNRGSGTWAAVICGVDYVAAHSGEIEVANMSLGGTGSDAGGCTGNDALHRAICAAVAAGVTFVVAAGNESDDAARHVPAAYNEVITVSALADFNGLPGGGAAATCRSDVDDTFANFSNFGADIDLIAPGVCIRSTWKGDSYRTISGTSMASPHVAGAAALYLAANPSATPAAVRTALRTAGNFGWTGNADAVQEPLLDVSTY